MRQVAAKRERVLHRILEKAAQADPDRTLVSYVDFAEGSSRWTTGRLLEAAKRIAAGLVEDGIKPGDRVALMAKNCPEFLPCWFAIFMVGGVAIPLNIGFRGQSLSYSLRMSDCRAAIADAEGVEEVMAVAGEVPGLALVVAMHDSATRVVAPSYATPQVQLLQSYLNQDAAGFRAIDAKRWDLCSVMFTSGTTGLPKGAMWPHDFAVYMAESVEHVMGHTREDISFSPLPLFHGNALIATFLTSLLTGGSCVITPKFSASRYWELVADTEATLIMLLGSMPAVLWKQPYRDAERRHRVRLAAGVPSPFEIYDEFEKRFGVPLTEWYGMSDLGIPLGVEHGLRPPRGSCGREIPSWQCKVVDDHDFEVPHGSMGEIVVRPDNPYAVPLGYWEDPGATASTWRNLWFHTGDFGRRDEAGWFYFLDRKKDAIRRRGENISAVEIEGVVNQSPQVAASAAYGVPSDVGEEDVMLAVELAPGVGRLDHQALLNLCAKDLPRFAVPRYCRIVAALPRTESEKIQKADLRREGVTADTWDAEVDGRETADATSDQTDGGIARE
jgi:crotonobetaine/carnitine-CoA ligase